MATKRVDDEPPVHDGTFTFDPHMVVQDNGDDTVVHETHIEQFRKHIQQELEAFPVYQFAKAYAAQCGDPIHKHVQPNRVPDVGSVGDVLEAAEDAAERFVYRFCVQGIERDVKRSGSTLTPTRSPRAAAAENGDKGAKTPEEPAEGSSNGSVTLGDSDSSTESSSDLPSTESAGSAGSGSSVPQSVGRRVDAIPGRRKGELPFARFGSKRRRTPTARFGDPFANVTTASQFVEFLFSDTTTKLYRANAAVLAPQKKVWLNGGPVDLSQIVLGKQHGKFFPSIARTYRRKRDEYRRELTKHKAQSVVDMMIDWDLHKHLDFVLAPATANALQLAWGRVNHANRTLEQCLDDPAARLLLADFAALRRRRKHYVAEHTQRRIDTDAFTVRCELELRLEKTLKRKRTRLQSQRDFERAVKRATT